MAKILNTTTVTSCIAPSDSQDTYATHDEAYGRGGYRSVATAAERDSIPEDRLKLGMEVYVLDEDKTYHLTNLSPKEWSLVKTFDRAEDLGLADDDVIVTDKSFKDQFDALVGSADFKSAFNDQFKALYKDEVHLGSYVDETTFNDLNSEVMILANNNLYVDTKTQIIYVCANNALVEIGSVATWNDVKGGTQVKFGSGPASKYVLDNRTIYFTTEGDVYFNGINYTQIVTDSALNATSTNPVQTQAVYSALNALRTETESGLIAGISNSYDASNKVLTTSLTLNNGEVLTAPVVISENADEELKPVVNFIGANQTIVVTGQELDAYMQFNFSFMKSPVDPIPMIGYTYKMSLSYYSENIPVPVNVPEIETHELKPGVNKVYLTSLLPAGMNEGESYYFSLKLVVTDAEGNVYTPRELTYTYTIASLKLNITESEVTSALTNALSASTSAISAKFNLNGTSSSIAGNVSVYALVDSGNIEADTAKVIGGEQITVTGLTPGAHTIQYVATYGTGATTVYSNLEYYKIYIGDVKDAPVINVHFSKEGGIDSPIKSEPRIEVTTFCPYSLDYYVIYPKDMTEKPTAIFSSVANAVTTVCGEYSVTINELSKFTYRYLTPGLVTCNITCGDATPFVYRVNVQSTGIQVVNPTAGLQFYLDGSGKSNSSSFRDVWNYGTVNSKFSGFAWGNNDGWKTDAAGQTYLRLVNGASVEVGYQPLKSSNFDGALTFTAKLKVANIADDNEAIIQFVDASGRGLLITPQVVSFASTGALPTAVDENTANSGIKAVINADEEHHIGVVIYPYTGSESIEEHFGVVYVYIDGIISGMSKINTSATALVQNNPVNIKLSATNCQLDVYSMRCYNTYSSYSEMLNMYLIDSGDYDLMQKRFEFNNILDKGIPVPGANGLPYLIINGAHGEKDGKPLSAVAALSDKDNDKWGIQSIQFVDPLDSKRNFYCVAQVTDDSKYSTKVCPGLQIQGTSSAVYPVKNLKIKLKAGMTYIELPFSAMKQTNVQYGTDSDITKIKLKYGDSSYSQTKKNKIQISSNSTKESTFTIKVDYAESSGSHNAGTANFVNRLLTQAGDFTPPQKMQHDGTLVDADGKAYTADIRTTCEGRPIMLYYRPTENDQLIFGGKANLLNDKSDEAVFGFTGISNYTESFVNGDADYLESDEFTPFRVITNTELAGTANVVYKESLQARNADGSLKGTTPFASWAEFKTEIKKLTQAQLKTVVEALKAEAKFLIKDGDTVMPLAFASDVTNDLLMINETPATITPLIATDSFATSVPEISGLALKDATTLYAVSDSKTAGGGLYKIDLSAKSSSLVASIEKDCEAVSVNSKGNIVVAVEGDASDIVSEVSNDSTQCIYTLTDESATPVAVTNPKFVKDGDNKVIDIADGNTGDGFEAVCHYSDDIIFIGNQKKGKAIVVYNTATDEVLAAVTLKKVAGFFEEIADFDYDPATKELMILDSQLGIITVWKVNDTDWTFTYDATKGYKCPVETLVATDGAANPEGLAYDKTNKIFYICDENGNKVYACTAGTPEASYALGVDAKENPTQCWEFRTNDNPMCYFIDVNFRTTITDTKGNVTPRWFGNLWESRFPDDTTSNNEEYTAGRVPYLLYTIAKWLESTNRKVAGLTSTQIEERKNEFVNNLSKYFNVNMLCSYYMITEVLAAADQRVKNMMWAFYYDKALDTADDIMHGMRCYPIFYDNDTILGVNNSGVLFDTLSGTLTLPWDVNCETTCLSTGYSGVTNATRGNQYAFSGHDSVVWVNLRELMPEKLKDAYERLNKDGADTTLSYDKISAVYDKSFTDLYAETVFNLDAVYKYVVPKEPSHYAKAQGSRHAHRKWFLQHRTSLYNAMYNIYDSNYVELKGGSSAPGALSKITLTMDHDWWCSMKMGDANGAAARYQFTANLDDPTSMDYKEIFQSTPTVGTTVSVYGAERAKVMNVQWDGTNQLTFSKDWQLPRMLEYHQSSVAVPATSVPNLAVCPNLHTITFDRISAKDGINAYFTGAIKLKTLSFTNCLGAVNAIELPEGGLIENLHLSLVPDTKLRFVSLPLLTNDGITFDTTVLTNNGVVQEWDEEAQKYVETKVYQVEPSSINPWSLVSSLIIQDCPNLDGAALLKLLAANAPDVTNPDEVGPSVYITGLDMEGDGTDLIYMMNKKFSGYQDNLKDVTSTCSLKGTYHLTTLLAPAQLAQLKAYFPYLNIVNLEYSLYRFDIGSNNTSPTYVTNVETGISGTDSRYAPTGHAKAILDQRQGYLVKLDGDSRTNVVAAQLSANNHEQFIDGTPADLYGNSGDWMIYEPQYWYKGINDFKNKCVYSAFASSKPESRATYVSVPATEFAPASDANDFGSINAFVVNQAVTAMASNKVLTTTTLSNYRCFYYVLPEGHKFKQFRVTSTFSQGNRGNVVIDKNKNVLLNLTASNNDGMYEGGYLFATLPENAYAIVFTVHSDYAGDPNLLMLFTSNNLVDVEPDWVEHKACFVGRSLSVPEGGSEVRSVLYQALNDCHDQGGNGMTIPAVHSLITSRGDCYTSFDYEQYKDLLNLAFVKYGTTNLASKVGIGLVQGSSGATAYGGYYRPYNNAHFGMTDTETYEEGDSHIGDTTNIGTPILMGYERLMGAGTSASNNDLVKAGTGNFSIRNSRTGRIIPLYPDSTESNTRTINYPISGKYLDIVRNPSASVTNSTQIGYCGTINTRNVAAEGNYTQGRVKLGYGFTQGSNTNISDFIYITAQVANASSSGNTISIATSARASMQNLPRLMVTPQQITFLTPTEYSAS